MRTSEHNRIPLIFSSLEREGVKLALEKLPVPLGLSFRTFIFNQDNTLNWTNPSEMLLHLNNEQEQLRNSRYGAARLSKGETDQTISRMKKYTRGRGK